MQEALNDLVTDVLETMMMEQPLAVTMDTLCCMCADSLNVHFTVKALKMAPARAPTHASAFNKFGLTSHSPA